MSAIASLVRQNYPGVRWLSTYLRMISRDAPPQEAARYERPQVVPVSAYLIVGPESSRARRSWPWRNGPAQAQTSFSLTPLSPELESTSWRRALATVPERLASSSANWTASTRLDHPTVFARTAPTRPGASGGTDPRTHDRPRAP